MSVWSTPYGSCSLWGSGVCQDDICELADGRVLVQMDDATGNRRFRDLICDYVTLTGQYIDVAKAVQAGFDVDTAVGDQLDKVGSVVGLPRQGYDDTRYRVFIQIQTEILLAQARDDANWTGTSNNILTICRTFIGAAVPQPVVLHNINPYAFTLSVPGITVAEANVLVRFICIALYAGVFGHIIFSLAPNSLWGSENVAVPSVGTWGSENVAVGGASTWGMTIQVGGGQSC